MVGGRLGGDHPLRSGLAGRELHGDLVRRVEPHKQMIAEALRRAKGNKAPAAAALGLSPPQLLPRIRRFKIAS
jgi:transcriptional regulator with GAF, ATPase, and Fis domain